MLQVRSDSDVFKDIRDTLAWDVRLDDSNVVVEVSDGTAILSGTVRTFSEKTVAVEDAWKTKGVKEVVDKITVSPETLRLDADIATDIVSALNGDSRLDARNIVVKVAGGVVELSGAVGTLAEKEAAEEDAWFTGGVIDVANYIEVSPIKVRSDSEIEDDIKTAITRDARIGDPTRISASSRGGRVLLQGSVHTTEEKRAAEEDVRFTAGVISVQNEIKIAPAQASPRMF